MSDVSELAQLVRKIESLQEKLGEQETEMSALRTRVQELEANGPGATTTLANMTKKPTSRRNLLKVGVASAGLAVLGAVSIARPKVILAGDEGYNATPLAAGKLSELPDNDAHNPPPLLPGGTVGAGPDRPGVVVAADGSPILIGNLNISMNIPGALVPTLLPNCFCQLR